MTKTLVDPFTRLGVDEDGYQEDKLLKPKQRDMDEDRKLTYLQQFRLNLVMTLGSPWKVKYDLIERAIGVLNMIEKDKYKLENYNWMAVYYRMWKSAQTELEKLDPFWKDLNIKQTSRDQLKAFQNIELFIEFLTTKLFNGDAEPIETADESIRLFIEFLEEKGLYIETKKQERGKTI